MVRQTITEVKRRLDGTSIEFACEPLLLEPGRRAILRYVLDRSWTVADVALAPGMVTVAHYWVDRPYNVYHWLDGTHTVAYYVSVADATEIAADRVAYTDLVVDVLLRTSGASLVLDEDELPADLDPRYRLAIAKALEAVATNPKRLIGEIERETRALIEDT